MGNCRIVGKLWSKEIHTPGFQNLKDIQIRSTTSSNVGSPSLFSNLFQLENLSISYSDIHEVMSHEEIEEPEKSIVFPQLKSLALEYLNNLDCFYRGPSTIVFPKLKTLILNDLESMKMFAKLENSSALFNEKIDFPFLEELKLKSLNDEVTRLWDMQLLTMNSNPAPMLRQLELGSLARLPQIPSIVLENLSSLTLTDFHFQHSDCVFSSSNSGETGEILWIYSQLPNLEELNVLDCHSLKEMFEKEDCNPVNDALTSFCGQLKTLELNWLPSLNLIPLHLFTSIASLTLFQVNWKYLISADVLTSLHQLEFLLMESCLKMKALVINSGSQIMFPSLKQLHLKYLECFVGISSPPEKEAALLLPSLESLEIDGCHKMKHFWRGSILAPRLQNVSIGSCHGLQHFWVGNLEDTIELPSLRNISFSYCINLKSISTSSITAPKLREVNLFDCYKMECFFPGNQNQHGDLQLPSLEALYIRGCFILHAFSLRSVVAPKLTQIHYRRKEYSMLPFDDLNHFLRENNPNSNSKDEEQLDDDDDKDDDNDINDITDDDDDGGGADDEEDDNDDDDDDEDDDEDEDDDKD